MTCPSERADLTDPDRHHIVLGLGFGDEGKGTTVDALARRLSPPGSGRAVDVVRFNGGPQAAHHVVTPEGALHVFAQLGSAMLAAPGRTWLSRFMLVDPISLRLEADALARVGCPDALSRVTLDARCVVVTPFHKALNRIQELARGDARHGSCGKGVGQAWLDSLAGDRPCLRVGDLLAPASLRAGLRALQALKVEQAEALRGAHPAVAGLIAEMAAPDWVEALPSAWRQVLGAGPRVDDGAALAAALHEGDRPVIFEGAQGVLLDAVHGDHPHVTPSRTTRENADTLRAEAGCHGPARCLGVLRTYATRHGAGPLPTEDPAWSAALPEAHNTPNAWQGPMRAGPFDAVLARRAIAVGGPVDALVLTHADRRLPSPRVAVRSTPGEGREYAEIPDLSAALPDLLGVPLACISSGPRAGDKLWC